MTQQWEVETTTGRCALSGRPLTEGEECYSVLFEEGETFVRRDYALDAWQGPPEGAYCYFKTRMPVKQQRKKVFVDNEVLLNFFERLAEETEPARVQFRFVLALILMRKRLLRYEGSAVQDGYEVWELTLMTDRSRHQVVNPVLSEEQIDAVSRQLGTILHSDMGDWTAPPSPPAENPDDSQSSATPPSS